MVQILRGLLKRKNNPSLNNTYRRKVTVKFYVPDFLYAKQIYETEVRPQWYPISRLRLQCRRRQTFYSPITGISVAFRSFRDAGERSTQSGVPTCSRYHPRDKWIHQFWVVGIIEIVKPAAPNLKHSIKMSLEESDSSRIQYWHDKNLCHKWS